jgi:hypothetical protein
MWDTDPQRTPLARHSTLDPGLSKYHQREPVLESAYAQHGYCFSKPMMRRTTLPKSRFLSGSRVLRDLGYTISQELEV